MNSEVVDFLMSQPNGANYVVLYQMLCLKTINTGGRLAFQIGDMIIPYDVEVALLAEGVDRNQQSSAGA